ncbi:uncharacterized protein ASPGLDRAFT_41269 [Aspergillus glaucus CBS 516.65]|uniref:Uncharacterized protein n=1 Tax=Aspergillus glaucus CBS 516.65 TaxID=1160497 RepID=A0A1L9VZJ9_ASPGL|nr:hypothetical protein ASPGLDRAFT_41269 [Aspergillus glaucus CBS 516.65]OJJ89309.1 hypothetical protein ASPGLDRAFT_41269 [Aspergillus glaucus CBS 516.65]
MLAKNGRRLPKKKQKNWRIQAVAVASQPDPTKLKPVKDCPKEAWRLLFCCEGDKATPGSPSSGRGLSAARSFRLLQPRLLSNLPILAYAVCCISHRRESFPM